MMQSDTRGPVVNAQMTVSATSEGVQATGYHFVHPGQKPARKENWITPAPEVTLGATGETTLLRKVVTFADAPQAVSAWMTAAKPFVVYVNGRMASRGPADSGWDFRGRTFHGKASGRYFYDCRDLTPLFHAGKNTIAVLVHGNHAPFLFEGQAVSPDGTITAVQSDASWRGIHTDYLTKNGTEYDGTKEPVGWQTTDFDSAAWQNCAILEQGVEDVLVASELPPCMEARYPIHAIESVSGGVQVPHDTPFSEGHPLVVTADGSFTVRFDRVLAAYWGIRVKGGGGAHIVLESKESSQTGKPKPVSLTLRDGVQTFESPSFSSIGLIKVIVTGVTTPVEIEDTSAVTTSQPVGYQGAFSCSDAALTRLWESCRWSTQLCLQTWHLDSPDHKEPIGDYGDYLIEDRAAFDAFGPEPYLARQDLKKWAWVMKNADYHTFHTSYALLWLQSLMQYYDRTADAALVKELAPYVYELLDRFTGYRGKNGLISEAPNYMFMDWVTIDTFTLHHPPAVIGQGYLTAFYCRALSDGARVAQMEGDTTRTKRYEGLRAETVAAYNRELWVPEKGLYRDGKPFQTGVVPSEWLPADKEMETFTAQNNVLAVLYDIAPKENRQTIMDNTMAQTPWNVRPYYMYFVLDAIAHAGLFDKYGTEWMRKWHIVPETQTVYEMGDRGDLSHGWIAAPLVQLSETVLGIKPLSPAYKTFAVAPHLCDLAWAKGSVPSAQGLITVSWKQASVGDRATPSVTLFVTVPPGTEATVTLPGSHADRATVVTAAGKTLWAKGQAKETLAGLVAIGQKSGAVKLRVRPGSYTFIQTSPP